MSAQISNQLAGIAQELAIIAGVLGGIFGLLFVGVIRGKR